MFALESGIAISLSLRISFRLTASGLGIILTDIALFGVKLAISALFSGLNHWPGAKMSQSRKPMIVCVNRVISQNAV